MEKKNGKNKNKPQEVTSAFITQPISQPDSRQAVTNVAIPDDENVTLNREWIEENKK